MLASVITNSHELILLLLVCYVMEFPKALSARTLKLQMNSLYALEVSYDNIFHIIILYFRELNAGVDWRS